MPAGDPQLTFLSVGHGIRFGEVPDSPDVHFNPDGVAVEATYLTQGGINAAWLAVDLLGYPFVDNNNRLTRVLPAFFGGWVGWAVAPWSVWCKSARAKRQGTAKVSIEDLSRPGQGCNNHDWYSVVTEWSTLNYIVNTNPNGAAVANNGDFAVGPRATDAATDFSLLYFTEWTGHQSAKDVMLDAQTYQFALLDDTGKRTVYNQKLPFPIANGTIKAVRRHARDYTIAVNKLTGTLNLEPINGYPSGTLRLLGGESRQVSTSLGITVADTDLHIGVQLNGWNKFLKTNPLFGPSTYDTLQHVKTGQTVYQYASWAALWA